ncbi:ABC transporter permease, partial [Rhabdothermincola sp.]|uniref:ABC transporter permease n=1 Tax=Rhabdothermincola sp. TaxID=2820405 RepID=UPI002FE01555
MAMARVALRGVLAHRLRLLATGMAVLLSVSFMSGTRVLGDTVRVSLGEIWTDTYRHIDVVVRSDRTIGVGGEGRRDRLDASLVDALAAIDGVAAAEGSIEADVRVLRADGRPLRDPRLGGSSFVLDWPDAEQLDPWVLTEGRRPQRAGEAVVDLTAAREGPFTVGDQVTMVVAGEPVVATVVGIASFAGAARYGGAPAVLLEQSWAERLVAEEGRVDRIDVATVGGVEPSVVAERIRAAGLPGIEVLTGEELAAQRREAIGEVVNLFVQLVSSFGAIALFVGAFIIVNTFTIIVMQRTRELALLRALGASRLQIISAVLAEALVVATVAALLGGIAGIGVARGLGVLLERFGFSLPDSPLVVEPAAFVVPIGLALVVTCGAALLPAWRASRTAAVEALRQASVEEVHRSGARLLIGVVLAVVAGALIWSAMSGTEGIASALVLLAAVPAIVGFAVAGPVMVPPLVALLGAPLAALSGVTGRLARRNALRNPGRTSSTAAALVIGVSLVVVIAVASSSLATTVRRVVDETVRGDFVVSAQRAGLSVEVAPALAALDEVEAAVGVRVGMVGIAGRPELALAADPEGASRILDLRVLEGNLDLLGPGQVAVARSQAERDGVGVGDELVISFPYAPDTVVHVAAVYDRALTRNGEYLFSQTAWDELMPASSRVDARVLVLLADGVDRARAEPALRAVLERWPDAELLDVGGYRDQQVGQVVSRISFLYVLLGLAVIVGLLGIANTLLLGVYERTRELGLLRAVGARRRQLGAAVLQEAIVIASLG